MGEGALLVVVELLLRAHADPPQRVEHVSGKDQLVLRMEDVGGLDSLSAAFVAAFVSTSGDRTRCADLADDADVVPVSEVAGVEVDGSQKRFHGVPVPVVLELRKGHARQQVRRLAAAIGAREILQSGLIELFRIDKTTLHHVCMG